MGYQLSDIVNEWLLAEKGETQNNLFARMFIIGVAGVRELHLDINGIIKTVELSINPSQTVDLPSDYVKYSKIGIIGCDGRIHSLGLDDDLALNDVYNNCGQRIMRNQFPCNCGTACGGSCGGFGFVGNGLWPWGGLWGNGAWENAGGIFGLGGGNNVNGYFRYDRAANQLLLANMCDNSDSIVLEYVADLSQDSEGDFIVHPFEIETIKAWMSWKYVALNPRISLGEKSNRERLYYNARRKMNNRYNSATPTEWAEALRKSNTATVRF